MAKYLAGTLGLAVLLGFSIMTAGSNGGYFGLQHATAAGETIAASKTIFFGSNVVEVTITDDNLEDNNDAGEEDEVTVTFDVFSGGDSASEDVTVGDDTADISVEIGDSGRFVFYLTADADVVIGDLDNPEFGSDSQLVFVGEGGDVSVGSDAGNSAFDGATDGISLDEGSTIEIIYGDAELVLTYEDTKADIILDRTTIGTDGSLYLQANDHDANNDPTARDELNFDANSGDLSMTFSGVNDTNLGQAIADEALDFQETSDNSGLFQVRIQVQDVFDIGADETPKSVTIELEDFEVYPNDAFYDSDENGILGDDDTRESIQVDNSDGILQEVTNPAGPRSELVVKVSDSDRNLDSKIRDRIENAIAADLSSSGADDDETIKSTPVDLVETGINTGFFVPDLSGNVFEVTIGPVTDNNGILDIEDASAAKSDILVRYADLTPDNGGDIDTDIDDGELGGDVAFDAKVILFKGKAAANTAATVSLGQPRIGAQDKVALVVSDVDLNDDKNSVDSFDLTIPAASFSSGSLVAASVLFNGIDIADLELESIISGEEASGDNPVDDILVSFQETGKDTSIFSAEFDYALIASPADTDDGDNTEFTWVDQLLDSPLESSARLTIDEAGEIVAWQQNEYAIPFVQEDRGTDEVNSQIDGKRTRIKLFVTDPSINDDSSSVETITFSILDDPGDEDLVAVGLPDLMIKLVGSDGRVLLDPVPGEITDCGGLSQNQTFTETGANTGVFDRTFDFKAVLDDCALDPDDLANSKLVAEYNDETASTLIRANNGILTTSSKAISSGQEITITATDPDQNHDRDVKEQVEIRIDPDGLEETTELLDETDLNTGVFSKKLVVGEDFEVLDGGELVDEVTITYVDAVTSNGGTAEERELVLTPPSSNGKLTISPTGAVGPSSEITLTLLDIDLNEDPNAEDTIDSDVLKIRTDNDEISDREIRLGEDGLEMGETDNNSGEFELTITLVPITPEQKSDDVVIEFLASGDTLDLPAEPGDLISISYDDENHDRAGDDVINVIIEVKAFDPVISTDKEAYLPGDSMIVSVVDPDANRDPDIIDTIEELRVSSESDAVGESFDAVETGSSTGVFRVQIPLVEGFETDAVTVEIGDILTIEYTDEFPADYDPDDGDDKAFTMTVTIGRTSSEGSAGDTSPSEPEVKDVQGNSLDEIGVGQQVVLATTIQNNVEDERPFVAIIEVRDKDGITVFLAWQTGMLNPDDNAQVGLSFTPFDRGTYTTRTFVLSSLANPSILSEVEQSEFEVS